MSDIKDAPLRSSVTARRLAGAFLAVLVLFAAALVMTLIALRNIATAEAEVDRLDHAKHAGHVAAAQVREQYIHQAHMLINFDTGHLDHYDEAAAVTRLATAHLTSLATTPEERDRATAIGRLAQESDQIFRAKVLPAIARGDHSQLLALSDETEAVVAKVVAINDELNQIFEQQSALARSGAASTQERATFVVVLCFGLAFVLAGVVGTLLARSILRPIGILRAGAHRVGTGDLAARITVAGDSEFAELAQTFNQMTRDLAEIQAALVRSQKLASIGQVAAGVAHEINSPIGVILGYAKLMRRDPAVGTREDVRIIEDEALQCQRIVQGLLDLARPQQLNLAPIDLGEVASDALARLADSEQLASWKVIRVPAPGPLLVAGDAGKFRQIICNLILNAAEATPPGGAIELASRVEGGQAVVTVTDTGAGISADALARVFDPFFTTKRSGTGLGLAIAQAIADAHGGRLEIAETSSAGTCVALRLPLTPPPENPA
jgi:two-component system NtrC family sensor kinase